MLALTTSFFLLAEGGGFYDRIFNIPGFEAWKFLNLAIFVAFMIYVAKKPLGEAFKAKRDEIRAELIKAEAEKQAALTKLTAAEAKLAQLDSEKESLLKKAQDEAAFEAKRIAEATQGEVERLHQQTQAELSRLQTVSRNELRKFSAEESIRLAEEKLRAQITGDADVKLVRANISEIGGLN